MAHSDEWSTINKSPLYMIMITTSYIATYPKAIIVVNFRELANSKIVLTGVLFLVTFL